MRQALRILLSTAAIIAASVAAFAEAPVDDHTLLMARFDEGLTADPGPGEATGEGWSLVPGRFGQGLRVDADQTLTWPVEGLIGTEQGTIELWMKRWWSADEEVKTRIVGWKTPANNYLRVNFVNAHRLGVSMSGGPKGATVWHRVDYDPAAWADDVWHHVAATWQGGTIRFYVDGEPIRTSAKDTPMVEAPTELEIGPGPLLIDDLRISDTVRTGQEIAQGFTGRRLSEVTLLTDCEATDSAQALGEVGIDAQRGIDERTMPLMVGRRLYERGVGLRAPGRVTFSVPAGFARLTGEAGACSFADAPPAEIAISVDGAEAFVTTVEASGSATAFDIPLPGACEVRIEARLVDVEGRAQAPMIVVGDPVLTPAGQEPPEVLARPISDATVEIQRMRMDATRFGFDLPAGTVVYALFPDHPVDAIDPAVQPRAQLEELDIQAAPGEFEAAQFMLCTGLDLTGVRVSCSDLNGPGEASIPASAVDVRLIRRVLQREDYRIGRAPGNYTAVSRFVFPNRAFWLPAGNLKQLHLIAHVPADATPGDYAGTVTVRADGVPETQVPLRLRVLPIELVEHPDHGYSMYYNARSEAASRPELFRNELRNIREHGCGMLKPRGTGIVFEQDEAGEITWSLEGIRTVLDVLREEGFGGPIPLADSARKLGGLLDVAGLTAGDASDALHESAEANRLMAGALAELEALSAKYPEFEFLTQHGDEVLGDAKRYPFIDHSKLVRPHTALRNYMTVHMIPGAWEEPTAEIDQFVDIRCLNGHSVEAWLHDGHDFAELAQLAEASGDELWIYHNMRGAHFMPEWNRILQGLYMWQSPLRVHVPWMWNSYGGDPFDDTDAERYDFGYAFPLDDRGEQIVSTLHWEACREGVDDIRYVATLEAAVERADERGIDTAGAQAALDAAAGMLPKLPDEIEQVEGESPLLIVAAARHTGADRDRMRAELARQIIALNAKL